MGKVSASPRAFHPRRPPRRNDTSANASRSIRRATTEAAAGIHIRAQTDDEEPVIMSASNTAESGTRTAKYTASPRRARRRVSPSAAGDAGGAAICQFILLLEPEPGPGLLACSGRNPAALA